MMRFAPGRPPQAVRRAARGLHALTSTASRARRAVKAAALVDRFASYGVDFTFDPDGVYSFESIYVGDNTDLGYRPILIASRSTIHIGDNVVFGPEVTIRGGNHRFDVVGLPIRAVTDNMKRPEDDQGVVIEDDVWIGTRAIILHGVTIGQGAVIGAGAVVTTSVPSFTVAVGVPARATRRRFTTEQLAEHFRLTGGGDEGRGGMPG